MRISVTTLYVCLVAAALAYADQRGMAIVNVTVVDVSADSLQHARLLDQTVLIDGNRITRVAPAKEVDLPPMVRRVDGSGMFLVPGLHDMHAHVHWSGDDTTKVVLPLLFANGVTGIRDLSSDNNPPMKTLAEIRELQSAIDRGEIRAPRILAVCRRINGNRDAGLFARLYFAPLTAEQGRIAARNAKLRGVDFVKVYSGLPREAFFGLMEEANRLKLPVAGHLPQAVTPIEAANAGIRCIEHARFPALACGPHYEPWRAAVAAFNAKQTDENPGKLFRRHLETITSEFDEQKCLEILDTLARNGTRLCPTHTTRKMDAFATDPEYRSDPRRKYIAPQRLQAWDRDLDNTAAASPAITAHFQKFFELGLRVTGLAHQRGVSILVGTDCYDTHVFPGFSYHDELQYLRRAGLSALDVLKAATIESAKFLGVAETYGSVAVGRRADLLLLEADPLADIRNTSRINAVIFDGQLHPRDELQSMIRGVEAYVTERRKAIEPQWHFWDAVIQGDTTKVKSAIEQGADVNALDTRPGVGGGNGRRALNYAAIENNSKMIRQLIDAGAGIDLANHSGFTPLMHAAESGATEAAQQLIESGANLTAKSRRGENALTIAQSRGNAETAAAIRQALDLKRKENN